MSIYNPYSVTCENEDLLDLSIPQSFLDMYIFLGKPLKNVLCQNEVRITLAALFMSGVSPQMSTFSTLLAGFCPMKLLNVSATCLWTQSPSLHVPLCTVGGWKTANFPDFLASWPLGARRRDQRSGWKSRRFLILMVLLVAEEWARWFLLTYHSSNSGDNSLNDKEVLALCNLIFPFCSSSPGGTNLWAVPISPL